MPSDVGLVAKAIDTVFGWFVDEAGYLEMVKRRALRTIKEDCRRALIDNDWDRLRQCIAEYERLCNAP
jgi:hypothetical protein